MKVLDPNILILLVHSLSSESEYVNNNIVVLEGVFFAEIAIVLAVPETTGAHMKSTVALLQNYHVGRELEILVHLLEQLDNDFAGVVAPFLRLLGIVVLALELLENQIVDFFFYGRPHVVERGLL